MIKQELTPGELAFVESHRDPQTFPEMELIQNQQRLYPHNGLAAHVIGYVGEVSEQELNTAGIRQVFAGRHRRQVRPGAAVQRHSDGRGRPAPRGGGQLRPRAPGARKQGGHAGTQSAVDARSGLAGGGGTGDGRRRGAVVALDPRNGEVLAMVSRPAFDPNAFTTRIRAQDWKELTSDPDNPLLNRAIQAQFAPGSTFKPIVALAALETGTIDENFTVHCARRRDFLRPLLSNATKSTGRSNLHQRHRAILRHVFLHRRATSWASTPSPNTRRWPGSARRPASIFRAKRKG